MEMDRGALEERLVMALAAEPLVAAAYLYGSRARDRSTPLSDVDVAVLPQDGLSGVDRARLLRRLLVELGRAVPEAAVEVRLLDELPIAIAGRVLAEGRRLVDADPAARVRAEVAVRMRYHDFLPFEQLATREGLAGLRRRLADG
jgi:predicted nucleotidyltransferase